VIVITTDIIKASKQVYFVTQQNNIKNVIFSPAVTYLWNHVWCMHENRCSSKRLAYISPASV